jgi:hypothetical protein
VEPSRLPVEQVHPPERGDAGKGCAGSGMEDGRRHLAFLAEPGTTPGIDAWVAPMEATDAKQMLDPGRGHPDLEQLPTGDGAELPFGEARGPLKDQSSCHSRCNWSVAAHPRRIGSRPSPIKARV